MLKDVLFGLRMLRKNPGFTLMAVAALALGIGANTAIFSVVNAVLIQKMPYDNPERLAMVWELSPRTGKTNVGNPLNFLAWRERNRSFERMAAIVNFPLSITGDGEPEQVDASIVSSGFFEMLGVQPILGRWFTPEEDRPGAASDVAILSEGLWRRRYGADPNILGRKITINNRAHPIVGVMPASFRFPFSKAAIWSSMGIDPVAAARSGRYLSCVAKLKPGVTIEQAKSDLQRIQSDLIRERPQFNTKWGLTAVPLRDQVTGDVRTPLLVLLAAVGLVLVIACANVANLMLMRAAGRGREVAVRAALGASGWRIARQLLVESTLLALLAGAAGLAIGVWAMKLLIAALPDTVTYVNLKAIQIDTTVFLFAAAIALLTGILFGLAPALKAMRADVQETLRQGGRTATGRGLSRDILVVAEVALSMVLLVGAGLLIRSFAKLASVDPGFDPPHVLSMQLAIAGRVRGDDALVQFIQTALERVRSTPGVEAAGTSHFLPLGNIIPGTGFWRTDRPQPGPGEEPVTEVLVTMPGYFAALNIPLVRGRVFDDRDRKGAPTAVVINQTLASQFYKDEDPVGKRLKIQWGRPPDDVYEIIGVVGDVHQEGLSKAVNPGVFICNLQQPTGPVNLVVRTHGDPKQLAQVIQREVHTIDRDLPISQVQTMDELVSASVSTPRFNTILLGGFAALALVLAAVGIFGVISYSVAQRTQELGVRRALGANTWGVMRLVLGHGLGLTVIGLLIGMGGALAVTRLLSTLLFGVTPTDFVTFAGVSLVLMAVAVLACYLPARRAAKVDPMEALRYE